MTSVPLLPRLVLLALLAIASLGPNPAAADPSAGRTLRIALGVDADTLDPAELDAQESQSIARLMWGTLYKTSSSGKLDPFFATAYHMAPDGKSLTFTLRPDLKCADGSQLTARDVAYSFDHVADPAMKFTGHAAGFVLPAIQYAGAVVEDPLTVTIKLKSYNPIALGLIAEMYLFCRAPYEAMSRDYASTHVSATGPYRLVEWLHDDRIVLERNPAFKFPAPPYDHVIFRIVPEGSTRSAELIAGNVDIITGVTPDQIDAINNSDTAKVKSVASIRRIYVGFNQKEKFSATPGGKAIKDPRVRRALQYAVDVPTLCEALLRTVCQRAATMIFPINDDTGIKADPYDPDLAERLLDEAGYKRGVNGVRFEMTLQTPRGRYPNDTNIALAIGQFLDDIGVKTKVEILDFASVYVPLVRKHDAGPMFLMGTSGASWSALYDISDFPSPEGGANYTSFADPEFFAGWKKLEQSRDSQQQSQIIREMMTIFHDRGTWLSLYFLPDLYGVANGLDWEPRADEIISLE
jgi:peptide/nickel transport system substrate-binding protein